MEINKNLLILGAGQYGQVVKEVAESMEQFEKIAFLDDNCELAVGKLNDYEKFKADYGFAFVAIGNADLRIEWIHRLEDAGFSVAILVSPKAYVSSSARLKQGTIIEPMAVVHADCSIDVGVFICAGAIVNHNSTVGYGCQLDCGSVVCSNAVLDVKTKLKSNEILEKTVREIDSRYSHDRFKFEDKM